MLKNLARSVMPKRVWEHLQDRREDAMLPQLHRDWLRIREGLQPLPRHADGVKRVLLIPSDPMDIAGSCGDEAMVTAVIHAARKADPAVEVHVPVWDSNSEAMATRLGLIPMPIWTAGDFVTPMVDALRNRRFHAAVGMGADIIDGVYKAIEPAKQLVALDLAQRLGTPARMLGASFSTKADKRLKPFFDSLDPGVRLGFRDAVSLDRAKAFTTATTELVADCAFLLPPAERIDPAVEAWIAEQRAAGRTVMGFNAHPMLLPRYDRDLEELLIAPALAAITAASQQRDVAWLLVPHDRRPVAGDASVLQPLHDRLAPVLGERVRLLDGFRSAAELKATAGHLDGVVTGRMHLAIASLGRGVPVLCITYQDKFEGLMQHFTLGDEALMSVPELGQADAADRLVRFIDDLPRARAQVGERRPAVLAMAERNFEDFD
ncbi:polysaccharide pyruvyl transferase family protein [Sphingomonas silueang]|uniref:polysaccharide pyruvyl transferase family protein n=1 Tax=Sphingomonas silueang TaxID=3156617 RepID=UPI0032B37DF4